MNAFLFLVAVLSSLVAATHPSAWTVKDLNRFNVAQCNQILAANDEATRTLKAIMAATSTASCAGFKLEHGRTALMSLKLSGKGLTDLSPFRLFAFQDGEIDLSSNPISDVRPLISAAHGTYRINLSRTRVKDAALLAGSFSQALVLDGNEIDDPAKLGAASLATLFSLRGNRSIRGADYDAALEAMFRFYALFSTDGSAANRPKFDLGGMRSALAPQLAEYITLKNASVEAIFQDAQHFYQGKSDVYYRIHLETFQVQQRDGQVTATFLLDYGWRDHDLKITNSEAEAYQNIARGKRVNARATAAFDSTFHLRAYTEKTFAQTKRTVVKPTWGVRNLSDVIALLADGDPPSLAKVRIPKGATLEDAFEYVARYSGGKFGTDDRFYKVIFNGKPLWARGSFSGDGEHDGVVYIEEAP
ncbi:MAG: hypothetical protein ABJB12_11765 [Pseudomonadota bacterium]